MQFTTNEIARTGFLIRKNRENRPRGANVIRLKGIEGEQHLAQRLVDCAAALSG